MEKKYLVIYNNEEAIAAFEDVKTFDEKVTDEGTRQITFTSAEGDFNFIELDDKAFLIDSCYLDTIFTNYRLVGRRTLLRIADKIGYKLQNDRRRK